MTIPGAGAKAQGLAPCQPGPLFGRSGQRLPPAPGGAPTPPMPALVPSTGAGVTPRLTEQLELY